MGENIWLVVKTTLDALRAHLLQEGQSGIPVDNRRLMDELQQRSVLIPNGDRAVWSARVTLGGWQRDLHALAVSGSRLWPDPAIRPETCHGTISPFGPHDGADVPETPQRLLQALSMSQPRGCAPTRAKHAEAQTPPSKPHEPGTAAPLRHQSRG